MRIQLSAAIVAALAAGCLSAGQSSRDAGPSIPYDDVGACPFEGCIYREWIATEAVDMREDRTLTARVVFTVRPQEKVAALGGVVVTTKPGRVEFDMPQDLDSSEGRVHIEPGQTLFLLTYQGEGFSKAWFNGRVYEDIETARFVNGGCADDARFACLGRIVEPWEADWWVQIRNAAGRVGWTHEPEKFDNKDALG